MISGLARRGEVNPREFFNFDSGKLWATDLHLGPIATTFDLSNWQMSRPLMQLKATEKAG